MCYLFIHIDKATKLSKKFVPANNTVTNTSLHKSLCVCVQKFLSNLYYACVVCVVRVCTCAVCSCKGTKYMHIFPYGKIYQI